VRIPEDPFDKATPRRERIVLPSANRRDRVIPAEKLHAWWKAASAAPNGDYFQTLLLTGLRRGELSSVRVSDVDMAGGRISIADTKNNKPHVVLLSTQAQDIVARRVGKRASNEFLFEASVDPRKSLRKIVKASGVEFSAHDCRRTFGSIAASLLPGYVVKRLMNHGHGNDVTGAHYVNLDEKVLRKGWQEVADFVASQPAAKTTKKQRKRDFTH
jgi:integrase